MLSNQLKYLRYSWTSHLHFTRAAASLICQTKCAQCNSKRLFSSSKDDPYYEGPLDMSPNIADDPPSKTNPKRLFSSSKDDPYHQDYEGPLDMSSTIAEDPPSKTDASEGNSKTLFSLSENDPYHKDNQGPLDMSKNDPYHKNYEGPLDMSKNDPYHKNYEGPLDMSKNDPDHQDYQGPLDMSSTTADDPPSKTGASKRNRSTPELLRLMNQYEPKVDPGKTSILLFPGQGSQFVGMGKELLRYPGVEDIYKEASEILQYDLLNRCVNGPQSLLDRTQYCQVAVFVTSIAASKKLLVEYPEALENIAGLAGFSVGEITALVMGGVMSYADGVQLLRLRGLAMEEASEKEPGGMMTVFLGADSKIRTAMMAAREFCRRKMDIPEPVCEIGIHLSVNVKVISGHKAALEFLKKFGKEWEIKDYKELPVSGAFHTPLMKRGENFRRFKKFLQKIPYEIPSVAVWSSDISLYNEVKWTQQKILQNYMKPVPWEQIMHKLYTRPADEEFPSTYEVGPGKQLGWVVQKINKKAFMKYKSIDV